MMPIDKAVETYLANQEKRSALNQEISRLSAEDGELQKQNAALLESLRRRLAEGYYPVVCLGRVLVLHRTSGGLTIAAAGRLPQQVDCEAGEKVPGF